MAPRQGKKQSEVTVPEEVQMLNLPYKVFKQAIISMFKELKETIPKELKESMKIMSCQIENITKKKKNIFK